jgi:hypothetical protein
MPYFTAKGIGHSAPIGDFALPAQFQPTGVPRECAWASRDASARYPKFAQSFITM